MATMMITEMSDVDWVVVAVVGGAKVTPPALKLSLVYCT